MTQLWLILSDFKKAVRIGRLWEFGQMTQNDTQ